CDATVMALLDPALLARIGDLELAARTVVDGLRSGPHRSPFHGYSAEFSQYRHYRPGDDLKYVDWKLLARTDRLYTKQFRETTDLAATVVVDCSGSMGFAGGDAATTARAATAGGDTSAAAGRNANISGAAAANPLVTKWHYATMAAAALAHVVSTQGDGIGLLAVQGQEAGALTYVAPRTGGHHLRGLLAALARLQAQGAAAPDAG